MFQVEQNYKKSCGPEAMTGNHCSDGGEQKSEEKSVVLKSNYKQLTIILVTVKPVTFKILEKTITKPLKLFST